MTNIEKAEHHKKCRDEVIDKITKKLFAFKEYEKTQGIGSIKQAFPDIISQLKHIEEHDNLMLQYYSEAYYNEKI